MGQTQSRKSPPVRRATRFSFYNQRQVENILNIPEQESIEGTTEKHTVALLGPSAAGKTTFLHQLRCQYGTTFSDEERDHYKNIILRNMLAGLESILLIADELGITENIQAKNERDTILNFIERYESDVHTIIRSMFALWNDPTVQHIWNEKYQFQEEINDALGQYFNSPERIMSPDYTPNDDDIIHCQVRTCGIFEVGCRINGVMFTIFDVGGAKNERRKWNHCNLAELVLFMIPIGDFDLPLVENLSLNRMVDSLQLFASLVSDTKLSHVPFVLIFNKCDRLLKKIEQKDISSIPEFSDFKGNSHSFDEITRYFLQKFIDIGHDRILNHFFCTSIDSSLSFRDICRSCGNLIINLPK